MTMKNAAQNAPTPFAITAPRLYLVTLETGAERRVIALDVWEARDLAETLHGPVRRVETAPITH